MAKLEKILESIENLKLTTEVALLENTEVTDLVRAQSKLMINENINFIKNELTKGGILEDVQLLLKNAWTKALMEDVGLDMIPTGEDVDRFAKNVYNAGKNFSMESIKNGAADLQHKIFPHLNNSYAGGGMDNGQPSIMAQHFDQFKNSELGQNIANTGRQIANGAQQFGNDVQQKIQTVADNNLPKYTQADMNTSYAATTAANDAAIANNNRANNFEHSQKALIDTLNQPGAKAGIMADNAINKTKEIYNNVQNVAGDKVGRPVSDFEMATAGAGAIGAGMAAKSLLGRVRRG